MRKSNKNLNLLVKVTGLALVMALAQACCKKNGNCGNCEKPRTTIDVTNGDNAVQIIGDNNTVNYTAISNETSVSNTGSGSVKVNNNNNVNHNKDGKQVVVQEIKSEPTPKPQPKPQPKDDNSCQECDTTHIHISIRAKAKAILVVDDALVSRDTASYHKTFVFGGNGR